MRFGQIEALSGVDFINGTGTATATLKASDTQVDDLNFYLPSSYPEYSSYLVIDEQGNISSDRRANSVAVFNRITFINADLVAGVYTWNHGIEHMPLIQIINGDGMVVSPSQIDHNDAHTSAAINLSSFGAIDGTWTLVAIS